MAPKQSAVFVVYAKTADGDIIFAEACSKKESADAVADTLKGEGKTNVQIQKLDLDASEGSKKGGKGKATAKKGKEKSESAEEDQEEEAPAKTKKTPKKTAASKTTGDDAKSTRKTIPEGMDGAVEGLKFVFTGTMALDRKTMEGAAMKYGGEIVKKLEDTDWIVLGTKPGDKKVDEINEKGLKTMSEEQFFEMLKTGEEPTGPAKKKVKT